MYPQYSCGRLIALCDYVERKRRRGFFVIAETISNQCLFQIETNKKKIYEIKTQEKKILQIIK